MATKNTTTDKKVTGQAGDTSAELVTPEDHARTTDALETPGDAVTELDNPAEVAARSADMDEPSLEHRKVFVLGPSPIGGTQGNPYTEARGYDHEANKTGTRQGAINAGLWPTGDVTFVSGKKHPDGESWVLTYSVPVEPAHDVREGETHPEVVGHDGGDKPLNVGDEAPVIEEPTA